MTGYRHVPCLQRREQKRSEEKRKEEKRRRRKGREEWKKGEQREAVVVLMWQAKVGNERHQRT